MSEFDVAAEVAGGAMLGRAVEPVGDGKGGEKIPGPGECLNCATPLTGDFCSNCGQKVHLHRTLRGMLHDIMHGVLHLDGKFWNTIPLLAWKPGELTRRYIAGQRARFISPIAFFLFTVVAMFALVVSVGEISPEDVGNGDEGPAATIDAQRERVASLEATLEQMQGADHPGATGARTGVRSSLNTAKAQLQDMEAGGDGDVNTPIIVTGAGETTDGALKGIAERLNEAVGSFQENPSLFLYKVQTKAYKLSWLLIPLSLPFMWLLFPFSRKWKMYDHAVFVTYSISFMMLTVIIIGLGTRFGAGELLGVIGVLYAPVHMYKQLRGTYQIGRLSAFVRTMLLSTFAWIVLAIFLGIMFTLGGLS